MISRIAAAVRWLLRSATSKVGLKFMVVLLGVLLPCSVVVYTTNLRATSNVITVNSSTDPANTSGNGVCTLREAINNANSLGLDTTGGDCAPGTGADTIVFSKPSGRSCCTGARILSPQLPLAGSGSGGAYGPFRVIFTDLPPGWASQAPAPVLPHVSSIHPLQPVPLSPIQIQSEGASEIEMNAGAKTSSSALTPTNLTGNVTGPAISHSFTTIPEIDVAGATNGQVILTQQSNGHVDVFDLSGNLIKTTSDFWCGGANPVPSCTCAGPNPAPPPICNPPCTGGTGFAADVRIAYDTGSGRWVMSAFWIDGCNSLPSTSQNWAQDVVAVSLSSDPMGAWNLYEFPACGASDDFDSSDQPHLGFNNQWIVVNSLCAKGASLAVFDKQALYAGDALALNTNWFEFTDPFDGRSDNPVLTYAPTINNQEFFTHSDINNANFATVTYSHLEGSTDSPVFFSSTETVTTPFQASFLPPVSAPGCSGCMATFTDNWIHSGGVWKFQDGDSYILSTIALGDPAFSNSSQVISVATNSRTGVATSLALQGGQAGAGAMASEIAMPLTPSLGAPNEAVIVYDYSDSNFYPGLKAALWNIDANSLTYVSTLQEGVLTPDTGFGHQGRWADFIDAITPIPGSSQLAVAGMVAEPSFSEDGTSYDPQKATYWAVLMPEGPAMGRISVSTNPITLKGKPGKPKSKKLKVKNVGTGPLDVTGTEGLSSPLSSSGAGTVAPKKSLSITVTDARTAGGSSVTQTFKILSDDPTRSEVDISVTGNSP